MPSILLIEDHPVMRQSLADFLTKRENFDLWAAVSSAEEALDQLNYECPDRLDGKHLPDLALIDVSLPAMSGIDLVGVLRKKHPNLICLMISGHREPHYVRGSLANGARGYVTKGNPSALLDAIQRVLAGDTYLSAELQS